MDTEVVLGELSIAPKVFESIVKIAAEEVDGVACVGIPTSMNSMLMSFLSEKSPLQVPPVGVRGSQEDGLEVAVRLTVFFGYPFMSLADSVRQAVAASVEGLVGIEVRSVDVFIDALVFPKE